MINLYQFNKELVIFWCRFGAGASIVMALNYVFRFLIKISK